MSSQERELINRQCLFCKKIFEKESSTLFQHMFDEHGFHVGPWDNLVMSNVFLGVLRIQLNALICIYCYKQFPELSMLHRHLRKKKHFKIDAVNAFYDQFYVINYLPKPEGSLSESIDVDEDSV